jgi:hypothetical protein
MRWLHLNCAEFLNNYAQPAQPAQIFTVVSRMSQQLSAIHPSPINDNRVAEHRIQAPKPSSRAFAYPPKDCYLGTSKRSPPCKALPLWRYPPNENRLVGMFVGSTWFNVAKHLTCLPNMKHRYNVLVTKYVLHSQWLPDDCLVSML